MWIVGEYLRDVHGIELEVGVAELAVHAHLSPFLDERLGENGFGSPGQAPYQLNLTEVEREALVDFLRTFDDTVMVSAEWLSNPF